MSQGDEPSPFGNLSQMCWVHRAGALFPHSQSLLCGRSSTCTTCVASPGRSHPLIHMGREHWCATCYLPAGNILGTLRSAHLEVEGLPRVGRLWRSREPVPGGQVLARHFPQVEATTMKALFAPPSIGSELRWGRITVHPLNPSN